MCNQGVYFVEDINWTFAAISGFTAMGLVLLAVLLHEIGHAIPGWILGGDAAPTGFGGGLFTIGRSYHRLNGKWIQKRNSWFPHVEFDGAERTSLRTRRLLIFCGPLANLFVGLPLLFCLNSGSLAINPITAIEGFLKSFQAFGYGCDLFFRGEQWSLSASLGHSSALLFAVVNLFLFIGNMIPFHRYFDGHRLLSER